MSKLLSELLGASQPMLKVTLDSLERASGLQSVDVRLSAEIMSKGRRGLRALGLDPQDTNGPELYHALIDMIRLHDEFIVKRLGGANHANVADILPRVTSVAQKVRMPRQVWAIRHSTAKRLLKQHPPKRLLKALGYRSLDSLLKRESMGVVFAAMRLTEPSSWQASMINHYATLSPSDFEARSVEIQHVNGSKWENLSRQYLKPGGRNILHAKETGSILVIPLPISHLPGIAIISLALLLHYINELRLYSAFFKLVQVKPDFSDILCRTLRNDEPAQATASGQPVDWRTIHSHFSKQSGSHPELFEPHVQPEDLEWRQTEDVLTHLEPALHFWQGFEYVGVVFDGRPVSFNIIDAATNYINQLPYEDRQVNHLESAVWTELISRYIGHPALETQVLQQLDSSVGQFEVSGMQELFV